MLSKKEQKFIKSLKVKKYRTREKRFLIEGAKNVHELLQSGYHVELVVGTQDFLFEHLNQKDIRLEVVDPALLADLGTFKTNDAALAVAEIKEKSLDSFVRSDAIFVLDGVSDPGNMGTIVRTLDWFGFKQMVCSPECADFYSPKVINSTMGSFSRVNCVSLPLNEFFEWNNLPVVAADLSGEHLFETDLACPLVIVMGSESHGVSDETKVHIDRYLTIPKAGGAESLNVAVATGIVASYLSMSR